MKKFSICIDVPGELIPLEVMKKNVAWCEFEVYRKKQLIATFQPDQEENIRVYLNVSNLPEEFLRLVGLKIQAHCPLHP